MLICFRICFRVFEFIFALKFLGHRIKGTLSLDEEIPLPLENVGAVLLNELQEHMFHQL